MKPTNPFLISGYQGPEYFCDREQETAALISALDNGRDLTLTAPRRMGKTGLILHVFHRLKERNPDIVTLYMDIFPTRNLGDFVRLLAHTVLGQLDPAPKKAMNRIGKFIRSCRPVLTFDDLTGAPKVTVDVAPEQEDASLREIFEYLRSADRKCVIAIDEFQQIIDYPEAGMEAMLRSCIQFLPNVNFIFAGSRQHLMQEIFLSSNRPFYQSTQLMNIGPIDRSKYGDFAFRFFDLEGRVLPEETFNGIYDAFNGHTWYVQNILNRLYGYGTDVDNELVSESVSQILAESEPFYADLMRAYPAGGIRLMKAIAREGSVQEILSGTFIAKYKLKAASSVRSMLRKLIDNELVYKTDKGYMIYDRFLAEWLRRQAF